MREEILLKRYALVVNGRIGHCFELRRFSGQHRQRRKIEIEKKKKAITSESRFGTILGSNIVHTGFVFDRVGTEVIRCVSGCDKIDTTRSNFGN